MVKTKKKFWRILLIIILVIVAIFLVDFIINQIASNKTLKYAESFAPVDYTGIERTLPLYDEKLGHYIFAPDDDLKIMVLTDIHICGGNWAAKNDRKTIFEIVSMLHELKPDLVILNGDNSFAVPGIAFGGGGILNNKVTAKIVLSLFEQQGVYFTTVFGNHDTESFDWFSRTQIGEVYASDEYQYCLFESEFSDTQGEVPSVSNQMIGVRSKDGSFSKVLMLIDSNDYKEQSIKASMNWLYDTIHDDQISWASDEIKKFDGANALAFFHIPIGEFQEAYLDLEANDFKDTADTEYIKGVWDEIVSDELGIRIWFGGCSDYTNNPAEADQFFEKLGPDGANILDAVFCGHDHTNTAVVNYKGVTLSYLMSMDNTAYSDIEYSGLQRGCNVITLHQDGSYEEEHLNAYTDLGVSTNEIVDVYLDHYYYENNVAP